MKKPTSFDEAFQMLDAAIHDISEPPLKPLVKMTVELDIAEFQGAQKQMIALGRAHVEEVAQHVVTSAKQDPLLFIGAAALIAGVVGFAISKRTEARV